MRRLSKKKILIIVLIVVVTVPLLGAGVFWSQTVRLKVGSFIPQATGSSMQDLENAEMGSITAQFAPVQPEDPKMKEEFRISIQSYLDSNQLIPITVFEDGYKTYGPELMLDVLNEDPLCHVQAHNLGRVIYAHTNDLVSSLAICQTKCTDGCIHGVLMGMFNAPLTTDDPSASEMTPQVQQQIANTCNDPDIIKYLSAGGCYHALGHVINALVDEDITQALPLCQSILKPDGPGAVYYCATGAYMQDTLVGNMTSLTSDKLSPCDTSPYPAACYRFKLPILFLMPTEYKQATALCLTLKGSQQQGCFNGVGVDSFFLVHQNPASLNQICGMGDATDKQMCVEGALGLLNVYYPGDSWLACHSYTGDASMCSAAAKLYDLDMNRDFTLYVPNTVSEQTASPTSSKAI